MKKTGMPLFLTAMILFNFSLYAENSSYREEEFPSSDSDNPALTEMFQFNALHPEKVQEIEKHLSSIQVTSNETGARVFINNQYKGFAPVTVNGLTPGNYDLKVEKKGCISQHRHIHVSEGVRYVYHVELTKSTGFLEIKGVPENSIVYVDGIRAEGLFSRQTEGSHFVQIKSFGYEDVRAQIYIHRDFIRRIIVTPKEAAFQLTRLTVSRKTFNPKYNGAIGSLIFTAEVTAPETGVFFIRNSSGTEIYSQSLSRFTKWSQIINWDGTDSKGNIATEGIYTATFEAGGFSKSVSIKVDYTLSYALTDITFGGSGTGNIPLAFCQPKGTKVIETSAGVFFNLSENFYSAPLSFGIGMWFLKQLEFYIHGSIFTGINDTPSLIGTGIKFTNEKRISRDGTKFCYGAGFNYGYCREEHSTPLGSDNGAGIGLSGMIGIETRRIYTGCTSTFIFGAESAVPNNGDNTWRNGLSLIYYISPFTTLNSSVTVNSSSSCFDSIEPHLGFSKMIFNSSLIFKSSVDAKIYFDSPSYIGASIGLSYLF